MPPFALFGSTFAEGIVLVAVGFCLRDKTLLEHVHLLEQSIQYDVIVYGLEYCGKLEGDCP